MSLEARREAERAAAGLPPLLVEARRVAATVQQGVHGRRRSGPGETFWQFRRYETGDPAAMIDWRRSAKSDRLYVREQEWEASATVWLWCDASPSMNFASQGLSTTKRHRANVILLGLADLLLRGGEQVALLGEGGRRPLRGSVALARLGEAIARNTSDADGILSREALPRHAQIVLIGDFLDPPEAIEQVVRGLAGDGAEGSLVQVLDPAEESLPYAGRVRFQGLEGEGNPLIRRVEAIRPAYHARLAAQRNALATICRQVGWRFLGHRTDHTPETALLALYLGLSDEVSRRR
ncbi:MAG: DUF58 domain-containing protein [Alphaproteobacteria bacterium]|jgi:uncharacterized protein (DUF58 family)|nr:DUF58 domain-containing protein [Alphaproteobacteria bacterium]MDP7174313.1 DUF58 domain-containing protein [Alphaproteobacteria bacterium]MDP7234205.1 DUF58 domain-containing protein [Alphaproteobacteria bacterium]MEE1544290.1 DUF58 domain-containing protein [Alphaproteobacteria bacterium]HJN20739.1 DUF58 domain-containing protein [Alphaproteobacteria bacterium]